MIETPDYVIVGSGINSLVCAAGLALKGLSVLVLEREHVAGGCMRTAEITLPGFHHDLFAMSLPLFVTAPHYHTLGPLLAREGLTLLAGPAPTAVLLPDGRSLVLTQSRADNVAALDRLHPGDGAAYARAMIQVERDADLIFGLLGNPPRSPATLKIIIKSLFHRRLDGMGAFAADMLMPMRRWLEQDFKSDLARALIAPWILHTGLGPDAPLSALMGKLVIFTLEAAGIPFVKGGIANLVEAFRRLIESHGGRIATGVDVSRVIVERGTATGVLCSTGRGYHARRGVICNVTPSQLYGRMLVDVPHLETFRQRAARFAYGRACMQVHVALSAPPQWSNPSLEKVALIHLTPGLDGVSRAVNEAERGLLPAEGTIVIGQPAATDPSRCPSGQSLLWLQLQELPRILRGDASGTIEIPEGGAWNVSVRDAYASRILARLKPHILNLEEITLKVSPLSPADLERHNINLVRGDPYSGACSIDQFHLLRPFPGRGNHQTAIRRLYHIGASTHPGPGLGGGSGHMLSAAL